MTAHELARQLLAGPDLMVTVRGYEDGVDEINTVEPPKPLILNKYDAWYYGDHEYWMEDWGTTPKPDTLAIHLSRTYGPADS